MVEFMNGCLDACREYFDTSEHYSNKCTPEERQQACKLACTIARIPTDAGETIAMNPGQVLSANPTQHLAWNRQKHYDNVISGGKDYLNGPDKCNRFTGLEYRPINITIPDPGKVKEPAMCIYKFEPADVPTPFLLLGGLALARFINVIASRAGALYMMPIGNQLKDGRSILDINPNGTTIY